MNLNLKKRVADLEKELIIGALEETGWVQTKAANLLGISSRIIRYKMQKYGIERPLPYKGYTHGGFIPPDPEL